MPRPLKVFLSHAHADATRVRALHNRLVADGVDSWLDKEKLIPGQDWEREIRKAVREADVVIVCLSKQFNQRGYRQKEVRIALDEADMMPEGEIFIIPARLEECENLESLRKWHWVDLFEKDGYRKLLQSLLWRAKNVGAKLEPKKNPISGVFRKPIVQRHSDPKPIKSDEPEPLKIVAKEKNVFFEKLKSLIKERVQVLIIGILILAFAYFVSFVVPSWFSKEKPSLQVTATQIKEIMLTPTEKIVVEPSLTLAPSKTAVPSFTPTKTSTPSPTPLPEGISDIDPAGNKIPMRLVPSGEFLMGSEHGDLDESPLHKIYLNSYYIDKYEVTNALYKACVETGVCQEPTDTTYYRRETGEQKPVVYVSWEMAQNYCKWRDARLPTEAEWEKAARGTDGRVYPWGSEDSCKHANYSSCRGDIIEVGYWQYSPSPYGIYDMTGNVWEWVSDWYLENYYQKTPSDNPLGPTSGNSHVVRGGSWETGGDNVTTSERGGVDRENNKIGFRCAKDAP